jgi:hypothetical protein
MKYFSVPVLFFSLLMLSSCEEIDTTPPTVSISSPVSGQTVSEIVPISVVTQDNEGVANVEFNVDDSLHFSDTDSPYVYNWNSTLYANWSECIIYVISYDESGNHTESQPIVLTVNNTYSAPQAVDVISVGYTLEEMTVVWEQSSEGDFLNYKLLHSETVSDNRDTLVIIDDRLTTSYNLDVFDPTQQNYFWVLVSDTVGYSTLGNGLSNEIDPPPEEPIIYPIEYLTESFVINWSQNHDDDFISYTLYESESSDMTDEIQLFTSEERDDTTFTQLIPENEIRYYLLEIRDYWGLTAESSIQYGTSWSIFSVRFGGDNLFSFGCSVQQNNDGGYIFTGGISTHSDPDVWLVKTDSNGDSLWTQTFGSSVYDEGYSVEQTNDGGYIITGSTESSGNGLLDIWLLKTDSNGNSLWTQTFGGSSVDLGRSVEQTNDGGYIVAGRTDSFGNGNSDVWLIKTDSNGDSLWTRTFGGYENDSGYSVKQTNDGGYIVAGGTYSFGNGNSDVWLIKTDSNGDSLWTRTFGDSSYDRGRSVEQTNDGGYIIVGYGLIKTDSQGNLEWNRSTSGSSVQQTNDGGYIIVGDELIKTDSQGNLEWNRSTSGSSVQQTNDTGYIVIQNRTENHVWLIKTDPDGNSAPIE